MVSRHKQMHGQLSTNHILDDIAQALTQAPSAGNVSLCFFIFLTNPHHFHMHTTLRDGQVHHPLPTSQHHI